MPAVDICSDRSAAGMIRSALDTDHSQPVSGEGIRIDAARDVVDELDDALGHRIAGRGLAGEDDRTRNEPVRLARPDSVVTTDDVKKIQELAFVLVDALYLHIEETRGIDGELELGGDMMSQMLLVGTLHGPELLAESGVIGMLFQPP